MPTDDRATEDPATEDPATDDPATDDAVSPDSGAAAPTDEERAARLAHLNELIDLIRPAVQSDGGDLVLVSADTVSGVIEVQLQGACSSCAISSTTLQAGVERILKERLEWVTEVVGGIDEEMDFETSAAMGRGSYTPGW